MSIGIERIGAVLAQLPVPVFLARRSAKGDAPGVDLHILQRLPAGFAQAARAALAGAGIDGPVRIVCHRPNALQRYRSLQSLARRFGGGAVLYDPTRIVTRSESVLDCGARVRAMAAGEAEALFIDSDRRTLFVLVDPRRYPREARDLLTARLATLQRVTEAVKAWRDAAAPDFDLAVRIGFEAPAGARLVAVDQLTVRATFARLFRRRLLRAAVAAMAAAAVGAAAVIPASAGEPEPAVSQPNLTLLTRGAWLPGMDDGWAGVGLAGTIPFGERFGLQGDVAVGTNDYYGVGGHLFYRDPNLGMIGVYGSYESEAGTDMSRVGGEGQLFLKNVTIGGAAGAQSGDVEHGAFGRLDITFYANPNLSLTGGVTFDPEGTLGHAGFEWQPSSTAMAGMSIFADGQFGDENRTRVMAGLNFHFGAEPRTLIDRDRRDDPEFSLFNVPLIPADDGYVSPKPP